MKSAHNSQIEIIRSQEAMIEDVIEENENDVQGSRPFSVGSNGEGRFPTKSDYSSSSSNQGEKSGADSLTSSTATNSTGQPPPGHMLTPQSSCSSSYPSPQEHINRDNPPAILQSSFQMTPILHSL